MRDYEPQSEAATLNVVGRSQGCQKQSFPTT
jgi:hypothetical protein